MTQPLGAIDLVKWQPLGPASLLADPSETSALLHLAGVSFEAAVSEAISKVAQERAAEVEAEAEAAGAAAARSSEPLLVKVSADHEGQEATAISREADRTGIDPKLLVALRRAENGGPGREFGVLSVAAPGVDAQARVAANTVRNTVQRFERGGDGAVDPATGRYTDAFLRYFSARYAPIGAVNDPTGLNRHHAANLIALYQKVSEHAGRI